MNTELTDAIASLKGSPHWPALVKAVRERRESWITDTRAPLVYQNHAELATVAAKIAELDYWLEIL